MNTKKIIMPLLLLTISASVVAFSSCVEPCGYSYKFEILNPPNGERIQRELSCIPAKFRTLETIKNILLIQGNVTAGSTSIKPVTSYSLNIFFTPREPAGNGFDAQYTYSNSPNTGINGVSYSGAEKTDTDDIITTAEEYPVTVPAPNATASSDVLAQHYGIQKIVYVNADFTGKISLLALQIYTLGTRKPATKKTLGDPSAVPYNGEITHFVGTFGSALANELAVKQVDFLDSSKKLLPVGAANIFFEEDKAAKESIWPSGLSVTEFYYSFAKELNDAAARELIKAAEAVNDPRLLLIKRATTTDKLKITAFGVEVFNGSMPTSGYEFTWDFTGANLQKIITDDLLRAIQAEFDAASLSNTQ